MVLLPAASLTVRPVNWDMCLFPNNQSFFYIFQKAHIKNKHIYVSAHIIYYANNDFISTG